MNTGKELGEALKQGQATIEIEGDLANKVLKIKATGNVAWGACIVAIAVAAISTGATAASAGTAAPVTALPTTFSLGVAGATWGIPTATTAVTIALCGGGIHALNKLRKYKLTKISENKIILTKK